jgi:ribosomal protein L11 methyltransferase
VVDPKSSKSNKSDAFFCVVLRVPDAETGEWAAAEAFEAGAAGSEERDDPEGKRVLLYVPAAKLGAVRDAVKAISVPGLSLIGEAPVPEEDWSEAWKAGLRTLEISARLRVRPSFVAAEALGPGQAELVIDPAQAFGTGAHESTRLALECLDALAPLAAGTCALDVGAGTGVLALAALRLGAAHAVAFDIDPLAGEATHENAVLNGLAGQVHAFTGPIEALQPGTFDLVLANLLKREVLPILPAIAARIGPGGAAIFSGLLASERSDMESALGQSGLAIRSELTRTDASGARWLGLVARRPA